MSSQNVRVGVGVIIKDPLKPKHIFAGIRRGSHGSGLLSLPGGHLELYESWEECAIREVQEETGLFISSGKPGGGKGDSDGEVEGNGGDVIFGHVTNDIMENENKHYVTIFMMGEQTRKKDNDDDCEDDETYYKNNRPQNLEPNKCDGWDSYTWDTLRDIALGNNENGSNSGLKLFGPLQRLIEDAPEKVIKFIG